MLYKPVYVTVDKTIATTEKPMIKSVPQRNNDDESSSSVQVAPKQPVLSDN